MDKAREKRLRRIAKWYRLDLLFLVLSLGLAGFGLYGWYTSFFRPEPGDLRLYSGRIEDVSQIRSRYGRVTGIRFHLESVGSELGYFDFYPSFEVAEGCLVEGASVTVGLAEPKSDIWRLICRGRIVSDIDSIAQARRENGRWGLYLAIGFGLASVFWIWRILSESQGSERVPRKAGKKPAV